MDKRAEHPRIEEVARRAGVSTATVSRFFNRRGKLAPETAERIGRIVEELGYLPNRIAGGLASRRSGQVAIFVPVVANSIFNEMIEALVEELSGAGLSAVLCVTGPDDSRLEEQVDAALGRRVDALIFTNIVANPLLRERLRKQGAVVVETWGLPADPIQFAVGFSHRAVGGEVARFLYERGYRRPFLVLAAGARASERRDGFVAAWGTLHAGAPCEPVAEMVVGMPSRFGHGRAAFRRAMEIAPRPDVVVCGSDWLAQGVIMEALHAGLRVPDELAVFGFGNLTLAGEMRPTISTVEIDGARIGRQTAQLLRQQASAAEVDEPRIDVGFRIVARESA